MASADKQSQLCYVNTHRQPFRAKAPLQIPKLWQCLSGTSYIHPSEEEGLVRGGTFFVKEGLGDSKNNFPSMKIKRKKQ